MYKRGKLIVPVSETLQDCHVRSPSIIQKSGWEFLPVQNREVRGKGGGIIYKEEGKVGEANSKPCYLASSFQRRILKNEA